MLTTTLNAEYVKIHTKYGNAIMIDEPERNIMVEAMKASINGAT